MKWKIELAPERGLLSLDSGGKVDGWTIVESIPGSPHAIIELPDDWDASRVDQEMTRLQAEGVIVDDGNGLYRPEHTDYHVLDWLEGQGFRSEAAVNVAVGDTFPSDAIRARGRYGGGVRVGLVDTGLDGSHVAFAGKTLYGDLQDDHGHGTHTSSTAASAWGIASDAEILMLNGLPGGYGSEADIAAKIRQLADNGCAAISLSLGGSASSVIDAACQYARGKGSVVVAAAGNTHGAVIGSPARAADLIVIACDRDGSYTDWTSGPEWGDPNRCTAVGLNIAAAARGTHDQSVTMSGTSMATPQIAGMVALLLSGGVSQREEAIRYILEHRFPPPTVGRVQMQEDFGGEPVPGPDPALSEVESRLHAIQDECDRDDLRHTQINGPTSSMTKAQLTKLCNDNIAFAADIQSGLGMIYEHAQVALDTLPKVDPGPTPDPDAEDWSLLLSEAAGLVGKEKWLPGSKGSDLFVRRGTVVRAPHDCTVRVTQVPIGGGLVVGEATLIYPDGRAVRFRHDVSKVADGAQVKKGDAVAVVYDYSMDLLRWPRAGYPTPPDGYQHLDLSLATSASRLDPTGGAGGDVDTYDYIWGQRGGLPNFTVIERTPGPPQSGMAIGVNKKDYMNILKWFGVE
jgi:hypothetical protein